VGEEVTASPCVLAIALGDRDPPFGGVNSGWGVRVASARWIGHSAARWVKVAAKPRGMWGSDGSAVDGLASRSESAIHLFDWECENFRFAMENSQKKDTNAPMEYLGFGGKLHHHVPAWVCDGACFHIRLRSHEQSNLVNRDIAPKLIQSAKFYEEKNRWHVTVFLIMPDHLHAILSFSSDQRMSRIVGDWKRYTAKSFGISWQDNFFDHRLRGEDQVLAKYHYILRNPEVSGLCGNASEWPWWFDSSQS